MAFMDYIESLDLVALLQDLPEFGLQRGDVGTVLEAFAHNQHHPAGWLVEFFDAPRNTWQEVEITDHAQIMLLHMKRKAA